MFDSVFIEVLISSATSRRFCPVTGVLQGSVLSPFLYSLYISSLPHVLRQAEDSFRATQFQHFQQPFDHLQVDGLRINSLLYADDVVLIGTWGTMPTLLAACERHSLELGYRWNPTKCVVLANPNHTSTYSPATRALLDVYSRG